MDTLWTPTQMPTEQKVEGGSHFDDELMTQEQQRNIIQDEMIRLVEHLNQRPDHVVYVGDTETRTELRAVFNWWKREGVLAHNPNIRIGDGR